MGVLACDRTGCKNIMCTRLSDKFGYICEECFEELKTSGLDIKSFMESDKSTKKQFNYEDEFKR